MIFAKYANKQNQSQVLYQKSCCKNVSLKIRPHATGEWFSDDNSNDGDDVDAERDEFGQTLISLPQIDLAILGGLTAQHMRSPIIQPENNPSYKKDLDHDLKANPLKKQNNIHLQKVQIQPDQLFKQTKRSKTKQPAFEFTLLDS